MLAIVTPRYKDSQLIGSRKVIAALVGVGIKTKAKVHVNKPLILKDLMGLLVAVDVWVDLQEHGLKLMEHIPRESSIGVAMDSKSSIRREDVELGKARRTGIGRINVREEGSRLVIKATLDAEVVDTTTWRIDHGNTKRDKGEGEVVLADVLTKVLGQLRVAGHELMKGFREGLEVGEGDLARVTAGGEADVIGCDAGLSSLLQLPVEGTTLGTFDVHPSQIVDGHRLTIWLASLGDVMEML